jgi:hypothetical protein
LIKVPAFTEHFSTLAGDYDVVLSDGAHGIDMLVHNRQRNFLQVRRVLQQPA